VNALAFNNATVRLAGRDIVRGATFAIEPGEFVGMLGANGAGKTTLMRAALGLLPLAAGVVTVLGASPRRGEAGVGYMPQNRSLQAAIRVRGRDLVAGSALGARFGWARLSPAEMKDIDWALDQVGARALADRPIGELSGGERQRLLLAQALIGRPKLLLLDEPLLSLDPAHQVAVIELARRFARELGAAVLLSAHELNPLVGSVDRILYLGRGEAVIGAPDDVVTGPVLSRLYGADIEVLRVGGRVFALAGGVEVESGAHRHEHEHDHGHGHEHRHA
jgi:zinc/manganese transport system ATP-binding protein